MKVNILLFLIVILEINIKCATNSYDYSKYTAESINEDLTGATKTTSTADQSVVYITESGKTISGSTLTKESGDSSNTENSEFYGVNAAVLVNGGGLTMTGGTITTKAKGANALCATNGGTVSISETKIESTAESSGRGLHATYGGKIEASKVEISSTGGSCATLATDRGEGTVTCSGCTLSTGGAGSPLIYSTGDITVSKTTGTSTGAQAVVVEGKNTASVLEGSNLNCYGIGNRGSGDKVDKCGVMLYQSMSGDADSGTSTFNCKASTITIDSKSSVYSSAPMFFITNTDAVINLEGCTFTYGSNIFLDTKGTTEWGTTGTNGGVVTLNLKNQNVVGNFVIDSSSGLTINLESSTIEGTINNAKSGAKVAISMDANSKITLTGNSYYTSLTNADTANSNIIKGSYTFEQYSESEISRPTGGSGGGDGGQGGQGGTGGNGSDRPEKPPGEEGSDGQGSPGGNGSDRPEKPPGEEGSDGPGGPGGNGSDRPEKPPGENGSDNGDDGDDDENEDESGASGFNNFMKVVLSLMFVLIL